MAYELSDKEGKKAKVEREKWERKAKYWHNAIPTFNYDMRNSLTQDVQTVFNFEQLELNKDLSTGIKWNNRLNIIIGIINLILLVANIILFLVKYYG